jgi:hypothetical protein
MVMIIFLNIYDEVDGGDLCYSCFKRCTCNILNIRLEYQPQPCTHSWR